jgi:hypothetical protein
MKSIATERAAAMLAEFDQQLAAIYSFDDDEVWERANAEAEKAVNEANEKIAERCNQLGIPKEFAPSLAFGWYGRGQNAVASRRVELRRMAKSRIAAIEKEATSKIERLSLTAQTEVIANGLESAAARDFLEKMPTIESMMPTINAVELKQIQDAKRKPLDDWAVSYGE